MKAKLLTVQNEPNRVVFFCPGCECGHSVTVNGQLNQSGATWGWNGSLESPTFTPSLLTRTGHYVPGHKPQDGGCWCTYNAEHPDESKPFTCGVCHCFVRDGRIEFLADSTHKLAGKTVDIPTWDD